jgi:3-oxoacyl-[acyl-carrier-protein] synthase-1
MSSPLLYIAGMGMITPLGPSVATTVAAVNAGVSAYQQSRYYTAKGDAITMAEVPIAIFEDFDAEIDEGESYNEQYDHMIKMAIVALEEACRAQSIEQPIPLVLAMPELVISPAIKHSLLIRNLANNCPSWVDPILSRVCHSGRAAGMEAIEFAFKYLHEKYDRMLVGGSDSHSDYARLAPLDEMGRLLTIGSPDSFAPGEAACFLLLTRHLELAQVRNGYLIAVHPPGIADEQGHLFSAAPYRGDGLDRAFKKSLIHQPAQSIHSIYSGMNGENHWAKEYGVAYLRNKAAFDDPVRFEHPADCYGDLGAATATTLIAMAAEHLHKNKNVYKHLVYCSSDTSMRGALVLEKMAAENSILKNN